MITLNSGYRMPLVGMSTSLKDPRAHFDGYQEIVGSAVAMAINMGYRNIDTSQVDLNLKVVGEQIRKQNVHRRDLFIVSKVWNTHHSKEKCHEAIDSILKDLQLDYLDMMLINFPHGFVEDFTPSDDQTDFQSVEIARMFPTDGENILYSDVDYLETWEALEEAVEQGKIRSIGLCQFSLEQIQRVWNAAKIKPSLVKVPLSLYHQHFKIREFCAEKGIVVGAYNIFGCTKFDPKRNGKFSQSKMILFEERIVIEVVKQLKENPVHVIMRWFIDSKICFNVNSFKRNAMYSTLKVFNLKLTESQLGRFELLHKGEPEEIEPFWTTNRVKKSKQQPEVSPISNSFSLRNGHEMPSLGISTWRNFKKLNEFGWHIENVYSSISTALENGYRHVDCGQVNMNLLHIGRAIMRGYRKIYNREDLFISAKVWNTFHTKKRCHQALKVMTKELKANYIDLALIHWPQGFAENHEAVISDKSEVEYLEVCEMFPNDGTQFIHSDVDYLETWEALEEAVESGTVRSIGLSNFTEEQVRRVWDSANIKPTVLQIEVTPYVTQKNLRDFCKKKSIVVSTLPPLSDSALFKDAIILNISKQIGKTPFQVLLRWLIQNEIAVLPKSYDESEQTENIELFDFELSEQQMEQIDTLDENNCNDVCIEPSSQPAWPFHDKVITTRPHLIPRVNNIPMIGISTWNDENDLNLSHNALHMALKLGIRLFNCSTSATNQLWMGTFLNSVEEVKRKHLFITARMTHVYINKHACREELDIIERNLNSKYIDLVVMQWLRENETYLLPENCSKIDFMETWTALTEKCRMANVKEIGLCNFNIDQLETIWNSPLSIKPSVVQVEISPYIAQKKMREYCKDKGIIVMGYAPFGGNVLDDPIIMDIADQVGKSRELVILRWYIENEVIIMLQPCDSRELTDSLDVFNFRLTQDHMQSIEILNKERSSFEFDLVTDQFSSFRFYEHKQYELFTIALNNGYEIPVLGFATWRQPEEFVDCRKEFSLIQDALFYGCRHIDIATVDKNTRCIRSGFKNICRDGYIKREEVFFSAKIWNTSHSTEKCRQEIERVLWNLKIDFVDQMLIHWPQGYEETGKMFPGKYSDVDYLETWKEMESAVKEGKIRSIGLCNFNTKQIQRVWDAAEIKPSVVQIEMNPYLTQTKIREFCKEKGIVVSSYAPFGGDPTSQNYAICDDPVILQISNELNQKPKHVILRWFVQKGVVALPKLTHDEMRYILDPLNFNLTAEHVEKIDGLDRGLRTWNIDMNDEDHPHWPFHEE
uniref:NADP-dependent oxidoreductase domain-containing protein n=2 Tax=Caenorhabditis japonica TaxID=281687 RepID=A0A8R1E1R6_CAEJA